MHPIFIKWTYSLVPVTHRDIKETWWSQITFSTNFAALTIYIQVNWQKWLSMFFSLSDLSHMGMNEIFPTKKTSHLTRGAAESTRSGASHLIYFPCMMSTACTGSVPVMTPNLTSAALGDTSACSWSCSHCSEQGYISKDIFSCICQPTALQLISSTHLSPLTWGLTSQMHSFFMLLILFHSEAVGAMQGPLLRWSSGSLKLCHPVQGQCSVNCIFFISSLMKLRLWLQETVLPDLLTSPMSRTWSFEVEVYSEYNKEHSGTHIPNTCIVPWPLLRLMGSEVSDLTLKHRISSNRAK